MVGARARLLVLWAVLGCALATPFIPSVKPLPSTDIETGFPVKFCNYADRAMKLYWVGFDGVPKLSGPGPVPGHGDVMSFQTYKTHQFFWAEVTAEPPVESEAAGRVGSRFWITDTVRMYYYMDHTTTKEAYRRLQLELAHAAQYRGKTGRHWIATSWPRPPVKYATWQPEFIGQKIEVATDPAPTAGQYGCTEPDVAKCYAGGARGTAGALDWGKVTQALPGNMTLEVMSLQPRVFRIENFITDFEADYMIAEATPKLHQSTTGNGADAKVQLNLRRSKSAWLHHGHSKIVDAIYQRLGQVTRVGSEGVDSKHCEAMNVLNYPKGGQYQDHFDWTADGQVETRFVSGLLYLNQPAKGGATAFPRARMPDGSIGTRVPPKKLSVVFFYDLLDDGNADELSYHAGLPVEEGDKWISPVWIWEPHRQVGETLRALRAAEATQAIEHDKALRRAVNPYRVLGQ